MAEDQVRGALSALRRAVADGSAAELCRRHGLDLLVLFGSGAAAYRDDHAPAAHDIDLAFQAPDEVRVDVVGLISDLMALLGDERVDLMDLRRAGVVARQRALTRGVLLFEAAPSHFAEAQIHAALEFYDTEPLRALERQLLTAS